MSSRMVLILLTILGLVGIIVYMTTAPTNCWDNYQTENDAIMHCEEH